MFLQKLKYKITIPFVILLFSCFSTVDNHSDISETEMEILTLAINLNDSELKLNDISNTDNDWKNATYYIGLYSLFEATQYTPFLIQTKHWANHNKWTLKSRKYNADDQASGQIFLGLYDVYAESYMLSSVKTSLLDQVKNSEQDLIWWWADALFMALPLFAHLSNLEGSIYLEYMNNQWEQTYNTLFSQEDSLFFRDIKFNNHRYNNGDNKFWLRGNGWVLAGLARTLNQLPKNSSNYKKYESIFISIAEKVVKYQQEDGLWRMDIINPDKFPQPETSGSSLICYALTWGVNNRSLSEEKYFDSIQKCWIGLSSKIIENGLLTDVQPVGANPKAFLSENSESFGSGAFLLFLSEFYKLQSNFE